MRDIALMIVFFGMLPYAFSRPYVGIYIWSWLGFMNPHRLTWGWAFNFPFVQVAAIATILGWLVSKEPKRIPLNTATLLWLIFSGPSESGIASYLYGLLALTISGGLLVSTGLRLHQFQIVVGRTSAEDLKKIQHILLTEMEKRRIVE